MKNNESFLDSAAVKVGAWVFLSWAVLLGPVGFVLLLGLAFAMKFSNLAVGAVCGLLLCAPLLFMAVWLPLIAASVMVERLAGRADLAEERETSA
ncbi:MAG: hypothetical protein HY914_03220 [Desulfomonile tiedjei]|nr:hypothetical protein [Desulfomonile tiedjei]